MVLNLNWFVEGFVLPFIISLLKSTEPFLVGLKELQSDCWSSGIEEKASMLFSCIVFYYYFLKGDLVAVVGESIF